jgi:hypothetical protein
MSSHHIEAEEYFATGLTTEQRLGQGGLPSTTHKVEIKAWLPPDGEAPMDVNLFVHLTWADEERTQLVGIDCDGLNAQASTVKALARELCLQLTERLERKEIDLRYICDRWIAQRFEPAGICPQINGTAKSVLDAAAKLMLERYGLWEEHNEQ